MKIDESLVKRLETLSMVEIEDKASMAKDLAEIVEFVEMLNELDTSNVDATFSTLDNSTYLREDEPIKNNVIEEILEHAPKAKDGFFIVPKIIE
ncbi:glutamyl-tRNA(Gln) amidotransferase, C subunit [Nautilia profundicola AmH]|uniref:Aspartyl/glutamyl-tRNA(Asn/Gln) amidotransferase subunit C n=1 Tax=Nautilia profundicola (strain ATCC BAA-1463 / DSM 18972 / AmH) TaxID=598659 RepID=GATC_NAUPA|nr:Asp-tRNA(Asn)/Glu-tRNA(Gln) amidotransferase subunit GatC [Nautilia profundicola]B9LA82.1 RecName: Full=Aspartyl/glutamyl-tRNA(Asn/Gln) amidotransferase subunit C; Short=Asp/Glu-ADT subunit C [Nautilia profundicola AmH]ACM92487.1 glutamyl-tRNA(Gln) amidotransferase, C subunit [Nautilia profundicola AmH]